MKVYENENIQVYLLELEIEKTGHITNTYIVKERKTNKVLVIDPAFNEQKILEKIQEFDGKIEGVLITHSHADHIAALAKLIENTGVKVYVHEQDLEGIWDGRLNEQEIVQVVVEPVDKENVQTIVDKEKVLLGDVEFEIMHTPGHTKGSVVIYSKKENIMFSGDTIFARSYGRTDLIAGSSEDMKKSLDKLFDTFEDIHVFPGHGEAFSLEQAKRGIRLLFAYKG